MKQILKFCYNVITIFLVGIVLLFVYYIAEDLLGNKTNEIISPAESAKIVAQFYIYGDKSGVKELGMSDEDIQTALQNGKEESMSAIFPLVKKYGGVVVALTLDENGIPSTVEGRVKIAEKIIKTASEYGISKKDIIFDTLAMTISADKDAACVTLKSLNEIKNQLGCHTSLGVSNVSFGLPARDAVNSLLL